MNKHRKVELSTIDIQKVIEVHSYLFPELLIESFYSQDSWISDIDFFTVGNKEIEYEILPWYYLCDVVILRELSQKLGFYNLQELFFKYPQPNMCDLVDFIYSLYLELKHI